MSGSSADQLGRLSDEPGHQRLNTVTTGRRVREQQRGDAGPIAPGVGAPCESPLPLPPPPWDGASGIVSGDSSVPPPPAFRDFVGGHEEPPCFGAREQRQSNTGPITPGVGVPCESPLPLPPPFWDGVGGIVSGDSNVPPPPAFRDFVGGHEEPPCYVGTKVNGSEGLLPPPSDPQGVSGAVPGDSVPGQRSHSGQLGLATDGPRSDPDTAIGSEFSGPWSYEQLAALQRADPSLGVVYRWVERLVPPSREGLLPHSTEVKTYVMQWVSLESGSGNGMLCRRFEGAGGGGKFHQLLA